MMSISVTHFKYKGINPIIETCNVYHSSVKLALLRPAPKKNHRICEKQRKSLYNGYIQTPIGQQLTLGTGQQSTK
jgi:hypothetical protein